LHINRGLKLIINQKIINFMSKKSTIVELVSELEKLNVNHMYDKIIKEAKNGEYHDFKSRKYACPKIALIGALSNYLNLDSIREDVINGKYDGN